MTNRGWLAGAAAVMLAGLVAANLVSGPLNGLFLRLPGIDKVLHVTFYLVLFILVRALAGTTGASTARQTQVAAIVGVLTGAADELLQGFTPSRTVEAADLVAGWCGLALGWVIVAKPGRRLGVAVGAIAVAGATYVIYATHVRLHDFSLAVYYEGQHDFVRAREHYLRALESGLRTAALYNGLGWVEVESQVGDPGKAVEYARLALDMQPKNADVLDTYGWALHYAGRSAAALPYLEEAYALKPAMYCIHYHLGSVYLALGESGRAVDHFRRQAERVDTREAALAADKLTQMAAAGPAETAATP